MIKADEKKELRELVARVLLGLIALSVYLFFSFASIESLPIDPVDESTHITVSKEMYRSGELLRPTLNGIEYFHKPPLKFWITQLSLALFGETLFAHRLVDSLAMLLLGVALAGAMFLWCDSIAAALLAALLIVSSEALLFHHGIRNATQEALQLSFQALTYLTAVALIKGRIEQIRGVLLLGLATGLAMLTKSIFGALPLIGYTLFLILRREYGSLRLLQWSYLLAGVIALPYFIITILTTTHGFQKLVVHEVWQRFHTGYNNTSNPLFYFDQVLSGVYLPSPIILIALIVSGIEMVRSRDRVTTFLIISFLVNLTLISISQSRLPHYFFSALLPLILLSSKSIFELGKSVRGNYSRLLGWSCSGYLLVGVIMNAQTLISARPNSANELVAQALSRSDREIIRIGAAELSLRERIRLGEREAIHMRYREFKAAPRKGYQVVRKRILPRMLKGGGQVIAVLPGGRIRSEELYVISNVRES